MRLIIASNNAHKITEIKAILGKFFSEVLSLREAGIDHETVEDGTTFFENAYKKAREIAELTGDYALADDSGICADALDGAPGIHSARFCGHHGDDEANNQLLLKLLRDKENKAAHYVCSIALVAPDGRVYKAEDYMHGEITENRAGEGGFGYDPYFYLPDLGCTAAELTSEQKNAISHRGNALRKLMKILEDDEDFSTNIG